jgi:hypothetical protein
VDNSVSDSNFRNNFELEELLAGHMDALVAGHETDRFFKGADVETLELLHIANQLNFALVPVEPSAAFLADLKAQFTAPEEPAVMLRWRAIPARYRLAARLGGGAMAAGLALLAVRRAIMVLRGAPDLNNAQQSEVKVTPN